MRAVIIGNGDIKDYSYIQSRLNDDDFVICADGGSKHLKGLNIAADIAIGDFDSSEKNDNVKTYIYPKHKDFTDGELAVDYALDCGYNEILLIAMTGSRLDHTFTNIFQLMKGEKISLIDDTNEIHLIKNTLTITNAKGKTISIIPIFGDLTGISATGVFYPLSCDTLRFGTGRGNSNVITDDVCTIDVESGIGLVFINNGE